MHAVALDLRSESLAAVEAPDAVARLAELLDDERAAALAADVDRLLALQAEKQRAVDAVLSEHAGSFPAHAGRLADVARENLLLLRHLVSCLRSLVGEETPTYGHVGQSAPSAAPWRRGAL
jgi:hypothetical protein